MATPEYCRDYRKRNRERLNAYNREYYRKNRGRPCFKGRQVSEHKELGNKFERFALSVLQGATHVNENGERHKPWDLEWNGKKVDVKVRNPNSISWTFTYRRGGADYLLLFCLENGEIVKTLLIPKEAHRSTIDVQRTSKYDKYSM
jgi:hypothetical protein